MKTVLSVVMCSFMATSCAYMDYDDRSNFTGDGYYEPDAVGDRFEGVAENPFIKTSDENVSTFSVDVDAASYTVMRKYVKSGWAVPSESVRIEEYLNYFTFNYPEPSDCVSGSYETSVCPWDQSHYLMRIGLKGANLSEDDLPLANYVFLVDVSGSMYPKEKLDLFKSSLLAMLDYMKPEDRVSIITYSGRAEKLLESTLVSDISTIKDAIRKLVASGSTNGGEALQMAYDEALANYIPGGNNRIIMGTDGDFNVGVRDDKSLVEIVEANAKNGIYLSICGFGSGDLNDAMMKKISVAGNGSYYYIDSEAEMAKVFIKERSKMTAVANDVKVQICFDADKVDSYRLIGYERRVMNRQDYDDDSKDAGEIGAGQTVTALYEIVPKAGSADGDLLGTFDCKYKKSISDETAIVLPQMNLFYNTKDTSSEMSFASGVAAFGLVLLDSDYKGTATLELASELVSKGLSFDPDGYRAEFAGLIKSLQDK